MGRFLRDNGLSVALLTLFVLTLAGQALTGHQEYNDDQTEHGRPEVTLGEYVTTGHFIEATFENWESEFLQMAAYVMLTVFLYQRGSSESKDPDKEEEVDRDPRRSRDKKDAPGPVRAGGLYL